jgi:hypothetical protein
MRSPAPDMPFPATNSREEQANCCEITRFPLMINKWSRNATLTLFETEAVEISAFSIGF